MIRDPDGAERRFLRSILGPCAGDTLEIGCGDGRLTGEITAVSRRLLGLDPDAGSVVKARNLQISGVNLILASGDRVPLADSCIDTVVFSLSLHHHPDPGTALLEAGRILRQNGRILVLEPEAEAPINRLYRLIHNEDDAYDRAREAIEACGLTTLDKGAYETVWRFEDFHEMVKYLFGYFEREPERKTVHEMERLLGDHRESKPLGMTDITAYWLLRKQGDLAQAPLP